MELTFPKCESIVSTLPIGFYTGRRIQIELSKTEQTSYYSPMEDKIVVSYPIIAFRMKQAPEECAEEEAVRSMLYHEVSHALLTPKHMENNYEVNCFEDERIESVLRHYYHDVDFRKQLYDVHGGHAPKAVDTKTAFFNAVRFGLGTATVQKKINQMLDDYSELNRNSTYYDEGGKKGVSDYLHDINILWRLINKEFKSNPESFNQPSPSEQEQKQGEEKGTPTQMDSITADSSSDEPNEVMNGESSNEEMKADPHEVKIDPKDLKKLIGDSLTQNANLSKKDIEKLAEFQKMVETIIGNFNKKNKGGSGFNAYSGVFNPRAVVRKDYRYFDRTSSAHGNNTFGTCHLNLIIDCSGSFWASEALTNGILRVLTDIEKKNRNFSVDVGFINHTFRMAETIRERQFTASGGNTIPTDMKEILMKLQKPQTCNYNIILFDGDALSDFRGSRAESIKRFSAFDMKQTTLITDPGNEIYMEPQFSSAKVVVTDQYTKELIDHIVRALTIAFA